MADDPLTTEALEGGSATPETPRKSDTAASDPVGWRYVHKLLEALENYFPLTGLLVSVIGYIVIAASGNMTSVYRYFGYILFLILGFTLYKLLKIEKKEFMKGLKRLNLFFLIGFFALVLLLLFEHLELIMNFFEKMK